MRVFTLTTFLLLCFGALFSQNMLTYNFDNNLSEANGQGPELTVLGNQGIFVEDTLLELGSAEKWVYRFEQNSGLQFDNSSFFQDSYTIEVYFVFDNLSSWKRVVDWKNRKSDNGAYVYYGQLNFYPYVYSEEAPVVPGEYTYYVVTRNAETGEVLLYADGENEIGFTDGNDDALVDEDNVLNFFHDDLVVPNEASSGAVAMLRLYNYVLDSTAIKQNYEQLGSNVFGLKELQKKTVEMRLYPNPANREATVNLDAFSGEPKVRLIVQDILGHNVYETTINPGDNRLVRLDVSALPEGIYMVRAESLKEISTTKLIVR